jgi:hypothetical protein
MLALLIGVSRFSGVRLLLYIQWNMLLAEAELAPARQYLGIGGWLSAVVAASHVRFNCFHM